MNLARDTLFQAFSIKRTLTLRAQNHRESVKWALHVTIEHFVATTANSSALPVRYRIAAAAITVLVHAMILLPVLLWQAGGRSGRQTMQDNYFGDKSSRTEVVFLPAEHKTASMFLSAADKATHPAFVRTQPAQEPTRTNSGSSASTAAAPTSSPALSNPGAHIDASAGVHEESENNRDNGYISAVREAIKRQWQVEGGRDVIVGCKVVIDQVEGGRAVRAWTVSCRSLPMRERIRLETAAMRTQLPYAGFESVFQTHLELEF